MEIGDNEKCLTEKPVLDPFSLGKKDFKAAIKLPPVRLLSIHKSWLVYGSVWQTKGLTNIGGVFKTFLTMG